MALEDDDDSEDEDDEDDLAALVSDWSSNSFRMRSAAASAFALADCEPLDEAKATLEARSLVYTAEDTEKIDILILIVSQRFFRCVENGIRLNHLRLGHLRLLLSLVKSSCLKT